MSEEMVEKVIFSITPDAKPKRSTTRMPSEKVITNVSSSPTSHHEKPVPRYLRGPTSTCHDVCKHGIRHDDEVKKNNAFLPRTSSTKQKQQAKNVNQVVMNKEHKRITSLKDLPPEKIIRVPDSPSYVGTGSVDEFSTSKCGAPLCDESVSSFLLSTKENDKPSEVSSNVASTVPLAAADVHDSEKRVSAELTDGLMDESSVKSDATDPSNMDNEKDSPSNQMGSCLEPVSIKFMIPKQLPLNTSSENQSEGSPVDLMATRSMEKCIVYENTSSNGAKESSGAGAQVNTEKDQTGSSVERMKLKNQTKLQSDTQRPIKQAKETFGSNSKVTHATSRSTPPVKALAVTCGSIPSEKLKTPSVTKRSKQTVACAPTDQKEGLSLKQNETKSLSKYDLQTAREMDKVNISPGRVRVNKQNKDVKEPSHLKENIGLKQVIKPVKQESEERGHQSKDSMGRKRNKEKIVAANKSLHEGDETLELLGSSQFKKSHDSRVPIVKLRKERITNPPSATKSQIKVGKLVSKTRTVSTSTPKVERIDLNRIKEKLRKHDQANEGNASKELVGRNTNQVTKSNAKMRQRQTPSSLLDERASTNRRLSATKGKLNFQSENDTPLRLKLMLARTKTGNHSAKGPTRTKSYGNHIRSASAALNHPIPEVSKVVLRHQEVQDKKEAQVLFNNVIEETASKLVETRKSKVKALVGAFETVISLQESKVAPIGASP